MIKFWIIIFLILFTAGYILSQSGIKEISDLALSPVSTFEESCSRCHGNEGSAYGSGFGNLKYDSLRSITAEMMFGPGNLNPDSVEIEAMTSYNQSLKGKKPFASVVNAKSFLDGNEDSLKIETSPNTLLEIKNREVKINEDKGIWKLIYNYHKIAHLKITVKKKNTSTSLYFPDELWTKNKKN